MNRKAEKERDENGSVTEILDGGVNGVAAEEEEVNEPGSNTATAAGDADEFGFLGGRRHLWIEKNLALPFTSLLVVTVDLKRE